MKQPLVSVIINCFNGEKYLREAIDSVYIQTYKNWEIIFWDNCSSDQTSKIANSYDSKLRYFRSKKTTELGQARVEATKKAQGGYIAFLDSDDIWLEDKLEKQVNLFMKNSNGIGFVYGRSKVIYENSSGKDFIDKDGISLPEGDITSELAKDNFIIFSSAMVDRKKFYQCGGFPPHFLNSTDYWVFLHMAKSYECRVVQEVCCKNRIHEKSLSATQKVVGSQEAINVLVELLPDERIAAGLKYQYANLAIMYIKESNIFQSIAIVIKHGCLMLVLRRIFDKIIKR